MKWFLSLKLRMTYIVYCKMHGSRDYPKMRDRLAIMQAMREAADA